LIHHVALEVRAGDADACARFWATLGFEEVEPPPALRDRTRWFERDGRQVHLMLRDEPVASPEGHVALVAGDDAYAATLDRVRAAGFEVDPRVEHWGSPRAFLRTPSGHRVEIMACPPGSSL
jgi:catechol 2,3-dioxygenase-like lactoylglutathione lyase family enzyme